MSIMSKIKKFVPKGLKAVAVSGAILATGMLGLHAVRVHAASTYNCDANSVVWCGASSSSNLISKYNNGDGHNSAGSIHNIYDWFKISSSDISGMESDAVSGSVNRDGDVYAGSTLVATNALTAGREDISGSTKRVDNGTTFYSRKPSVSFLDGSLSAMVVMKNGVFQFAILNSCGNPVTGTPKKPNYSILKQVRAEGSSSYSSNVTVKSGTTVQYQITVSSTGAVPVDNVKVRDSLPSDITYTSGSLKWNGNSISSAKASDFFGSNGLIMASLKNGSKSVFTFNAVAGKTSATSNSCKAETLNNEGYISTTGLSTEQSGAKVTTQCTPPPPQVTLTCNELTLTPGSIDQTTGDQSYALTATGSAKNATITGYNFTFGDGATKTINTSATSASTTHTYVPGTYTASVNVAATADGKSYNATSANCQKSITVKQPTPGTLTCDELTLTPGTAESNGDTPYTLQATASESKATIASYTFQFGDGATKTINTSATSASTTHTYAPGTYNAAVTVNGTVNGKSVSESSTNCAGSLTVKPPTPPPTPVYTCDGLTATPAGDADAEGNVAYNLVATASASNATITSYGFNFGDNSPSQTVTSGNTSASIIHTYAPGTYTAQVTVTVTLGDGTQKQVTSNACKAQITVAPQTCTSPTNGKTYPKGSSECQQPPTCTAPNGKTYPKGSSQCAPTCTSPTNGQTYPAGSSQCAPTCESPTTGKTYPMGSSECQPTATVLPNTGPGNIIGLFAGATAAGFAGYRLFLMRRLARR
jgi:uncharacterized repeat protein (TIGR01451 family)